MQIFDENRVKKLAEFDNEAILYEESLIKNHETSQNCYEKELKELMPGRPKKSSQHLTYKKILEQLSKNDDYKEAYKLKVICDSFEQESEEKAKFDKTNKITSMVHTLSTYQQKELYVHQKKIEQSRIILIRRGNQDCEKYAYH